jgi:xanthine dehydrogenase YagS FAD-binding subunit
LGKDGNTSLVRQGENRYHAIFGNDGDALFVSPSSLAPALIALGTTVNIVGPNGRTRKVSAADFFRTPKSDTERETALQPNEIVTDLVVPNLGLKNATYEVRHRHGLDWPYVTASVAFQVKDGSASNAKVVLGHVAPVPWVANDAGSVLSGRKIDADLAAKCADLATKGAKPLSQNGYKVQMIKAAVRRAVAAAAGL